MLAGAARGETGSKGGEGRVSLLVAPANTSVNLPLQLMKATVLAESSILYSFSSSSVHSSDVYE